MLISANDLWEKFRQAGGYHFLPKTACGTTYMCLRRNYLFAIEKNEGQTMIVFGGGNFDIFSNI